MSIEEVFEKVSRSFAPHVMGLDNWQSLYYIIFDSKPIGIISERRSLQTSLPKIHVENEKMHRTAYAKGVGKQIFSLVQNHIQEKRDEQKKLAADERMKAMQEFQSVCIQHLEQLQGNGQIVYDKIRKSKSTESIYLYKDKKRILRISAHPSALKANYGGSIIIKSEDLETKLDDTIIQAAPPAPPPAPASVSKKAARKAAAAETVKSDRGA